jgi:endonuclease/exonuclease/phosphatase family protein
MEPFYRKVGFALLAGCALLGACAEEGDPTAVAAPAPAFAGVSETAPSTPFSLLQMNLCLSGFAGCFPGTQYPSIVNEAIELINAHQPNAVTFNEACSGDVAHIATETGYHMRFATVLIRGAPLDCRTPLGRGVFGNAVMTKEEIKESADQAFTAQAGTEERRWICVATARQVNVCTTHLSTTGSVAARAANDGQCLELAAILAQRAEAAPTIAGGDFNRLTSCTDAGMWTLTDAAAAQLPGIQHSYGSTEDFLAPQGEILPATFTDHDFLLVKTRLVPPRRP